MSNFFEASAASEVGKEFTPAPQTMETRFGTLEFPNGYPTERDRSSRSTTNSICNAPPSSTWTCTRPCRRMV